MEEKIIEVLNSIRPYLQSDGGDLEFIKYEDNQVYIKLTGNCKGCARRDETITIGIFDALKQSIPEIEGVINLEL